MDPKHGGNPKLAPLTGFSAKEPFFKAKIGKKPNFTYITFLCGQDREKCVSDDGRYEWTGVKKKEAPQKWNITTSKEIAAQAKAERSERARTAAQAGAAKRKAAKKGQTVTSKTATKAKGKSKKTPAKATTESKPKAKAESKPKAKVEAESKPKAKK